MTHHAPVRRQAIRWTERPAGAPQRGPTYEAAVVALLVVWSVAANTLVPDRAAVLVNVTAAGLLLLLAHRSGADARALGLRVRSLGSGIRLGLAAAVVVALAVTATAAVPALRPVLADSRVAGVAASEMLYVVTMRIPIGTALAEEVAFRGVVLGMLLRWTAPIRATVWSSLLFGLWHVLPATAALGSASVIVASTGPLTNALLVMGQIAATAVAGAGFAWLRLRSDSIAAPIVAHTALNSTAYAAGWLIARGGVA